MWGCATIPWHQGMALTGTIIGVLIIFLLFLLALRVYNTRTDKNRIRDQDESDSIVILRLRYASGEISTEEYLKIKQVLEKK